MLRRDEAAIEEEELDYDESMEGLDLYPTGSLEMEGNEEELGAHYLATYSTSYRIHILVYVIVESEYLGLAWL